MSPETKTVPMIDFSNQELKPGTPLWNSSKIQARKALEEYGCFEASFDKIPLELRKAIFCSIAECFDLPLETKLKNTSKNSSRGYFGQHPTVPLFESLAIEDAIFLRKFENFTKIFWPEGNPNVSETLHSYTLQLSELEKMVRRMVLESLNVEQYMDEHFESTYSLLRLMKYKEPATEEIKVGLSHHTDMNLLTILYQNQVHGLEVQTKDGQWIRFKPSTPDSFLVMIGDSFHAWTNGRLHSPPHQVMLTGNETRYSIGLFTIPKDGYVVKAPEELVDEEHPLLFNSFDYLDYVGFYYSGEARKFSYPLKAYCGVQPQSM